MDEFKKRLNAIRIRRTNAKAIKDSSRRLNENVNCNRLMRELKRDMEPYELTLEDVA